MKIKVYIDTSVLGGCFDIEFQEWSNEIINEFIEGNKIAVVSDVTLDELENAPNNVQDILNIIPEVNKETIITTTEVEELANKYVVEGAITLKFYQDALHIALATINNINVLASWNFKHIVNLHRIRQYNSVNLRNGYPILEIRSPREIINIEEND